MRKGHRQISLREQERFDGKVDKLFGRVPNELVGHVELVTDSA